MKTSHDIWQEILDLKKSQALLEDSIWTSEDWKKFDEVTADALANITRLANLYPKESNPEKDIARDAFNQLAAETMKSLREKSKFDEFVIKLRDLQSQFNTQREKERQKSA